MSWTSRGRIPLDECNVRTARRPLSMGQTGNRPEFKLLDMEMTWCLYLLYATLDRWSAADVMESIDRRDALIFRFVAQLGGGGNLFATQKSRNNLTPVDWLFFDFFDMTTSFRVVPRDGAHEQMNCTNDRASPLRISLWSQTANSIRGQGPGTGWQKRRRQLWIMVTMVDQWLQANPTSKFSALQAE
jgi:hypothetical protein